eukprot:PITA_23641
MEGKTEDRRVCIIGAGMSGLLATKYLLSRNLKPTVFEAKQGIGGLWRETFSSTKLQTSRPAFEFTDFPWPSHVTNQFPTHSEVLDYFQSYAMHFGLLDYIHFNSKVVEIRYIGQEYCENSLEHAGLWGKNGGPYANNAVWEVGVQKINGESTEWHHFEFLILCIGRYGDVPKIPSLPPGKGPEVFQGKVLHTLDYSALDEKSADELIKGKKIVVIGIRKSAMDLAVECAEANQGGHPCTLVFRTAHWTMPSDSVWGVPLSFFYGTRFAQLLLEKPGQGFLYSLISRLFAPMRWAMFKFLELYLIWKLPLRKYGLVPHHSFLRELTSCQISSLPDGLFSKAEEGCIHFRKSTNWGFCSKGIVLDDQTVVEADLVLFATGYDSEKKLKSLLPKIFAEPLEKSAVVPLYRGLIHPRIPCMAILGYPECLSNLHSTEIRTQWLAHFLSGKFVLPSIREMEADIDSHSKHMKKFTPLYSKICLDSFQIWDNDTLCRDMGRNPMRKKNWFCELFSPYSNSDYREW